MAPIRSAPRALALLALAVAALVLSPAIANAAPRASVVTGTIALADDQSVSAWSSRVSDGVTYGDAVSFNTTVSGRLDRGVTVHIRVTCNESGSLVYNMQGGVDWAFPLVTGTVSSSWSGGAATCDAWLVAADYTSKRPTITVLATTTFDVAAA
jgi:hypothetical protein